MIDIRLISRSYPAAFTECYVTTPAYFFRLDQNFGPVDNLLQRSEILKNIYTDISRLKYTTNITSAVTSDNTSHHCVGTCETFVTTC